MSRLASVQPPAPRAVVGSKPSSPSSRMRAAHPKPADMQLVGQTSVAIRRSSRETLRAHTYGGRVFECFDRCGGRVVVLHPRHTDWLA